MSVTTRFLRNRMSQKIRRSFLVLSGVQRSTKYLNNAGRNAKRAASTTATRRKAAANDDTHTNDGKHTGNDAKYTGNPVANINGTSRKPGSESVILGPDLVRSLESLGMTELRHVQKRAFGPVMKKENVVLISPLGSGKTYAYLIPLLERMRLDRLPKRNRNFGEHFGSFGAAFMDGSKDGSTISTKSSSCSGVSSTNSRQKNTPTRTTSVSMLILVPTREIAQQLGSSVLSLVGSLGEFGDTESVSIVYDNQDFGDLQKSQLEHSNILIATPGRCQWLLLKKHLSLENLQYLVLDETDGMRNRRNCSVGLRNILAHLNSQNGSGKLNPYRNVQMVAVANLQVPIEIRETLEGFLRQRQNKSELFKTIVVRKNQSTGSSSVERVDRKLTEEEKHSSASKNEQDSATDGEKSSGESSRSSTIKDVFLNEEIQYLAESCDSNVSHILYDVHGDDQRTHALLQVLDLQDGQSSLDEDENSVQGQLSAEDGMQTPNEGILDGNPMGDPLDIALQGEMHDLTNESSGDGLNGQEDSEDDFDPESLEKRIMTTSTTSRTSPTMTNNTNNGNTAKLRKTILFVDSILEADVLLTHPVLQRYFRLRVLHEKIPAHKREKALEEFREVGEEFQENKRDSQYDNPFRKTLKRSDNRPLLLITLDHAVRGLSFGEVHLVVSYHPPKDLESFLSRAMLLSPTTDGDLTKTRKRRRNVILYASDSVLNSNTVNKSGETIESQKAKSLEADLQKLSSLLKVSGPERSPTDSREEMSSEERRLSYRKTSYRNRDRFHLKHHSLPDIETLKKSSFERLMKDLNLVDSTDYAALIPLAEKLIREGKGLDTFCGALAMLDGRQVSTSADSKTSTTSLLGSQKGFVTVQVHDPGFLRYEKSEKVMEMITSRVGNSTNGIANQNGDGTERKVGTIMRTKHGWVVDVAEDVLPILRLQDDITKIDVLPRISPERIRRSRLPWDRLRKKNVKKKPKMSSFL